MATMSSLGIGSGLDAESIVTQLMQIERQPINRLDTKESSYQTKLSAFGTLSSLLSTLKDSAKNLKNGLPMEAISGKDAVLTAAATSSALPGSFQIGVTHIASFGRVTSATAYGATDTLSAGTLTINIGTLEDNNVLPADRNGSNWSFTQTQSINVNFAGGNLSQLRDAINNQAGSAITAQVVTAVDGQHLVFSSKEKGLSNAFQLSGTGDMASFAYDVLSASNPSMTENSIPWSTEVLLDGLKVRSTTGQITDAIKGVSLTIKSETTTGETIDLTIDRDSTALQAQVQAFVNAYNSVKSNITTSTAYNAATKTAATLNGESTVRSIDSFLSNALSKVPDGLTSGFTRLTDIGITLGTGGKLEFDSSKLNAAISSDAESVSALLSEYGDQFSKTVSSIIGSDGILSARTSGINRLIKDIDNQKEVLERRMTVIEQQYRTKFSALDTLVASMQKTSTYLSQQLANL